MIGKSEDMSKVYYQLVHWLIGIKGIGRVKTRQIINGIQDPECICYGGLEVLKSVEAQIGISARALLNSRKPDVTEASYNANMAAADGIVTYWDPRYPESLKQVNDPPLILYYKGNVDLLADYLPKVAVVGTRVPTDYGRKYGTEVSRLMAELGYVIVSGVAMGIDAVAHRAALDANGMSIGVLGCGVDQIYPKQNERLYHDLSAKGLLVSEYAVGVQPHPIHFPERNRIISGLSETCFVVEAASKSGSLITAEMTMDLGRDVYALPGPIFSQKSIGCHELIQNGASPIVSLKALSEVFANDNGGAIKCNRASLELEKAKHPIVRMLHEKGQLTFDELFELLEMNIPELMAELDALENDKMVKSCGFLYHL